LNKNSKDHFIVVVCGSIGYGGLESIRKVQSFLRSEGFQVLDHISEENMDYSEISDFRDKQQLAKRITEHDLNFIAKSDLVVVISNGPSYGTAIEMYSAYQSGKPVVFYSKKSVPTPWPVAFSNSVTYSLENLVLTLRKYAYSLPRRAEN
jgi:nucleoside 2-deoxyribosyltransferase